MKKLTFGYAYGGRIAPTTTDYCLLFLLVFGLYTLRPSVFSFTF